MRLILIGVVVLVGAALADSVIVGKDGKVTQVPGRLVPEAGTVIETAPTPTLEERLSTIASNQAKIADALRKAVPSTTNDLKNVPSIAVKVEPPK
jgi:hypothetical protein